MENHDDQYSMGIYLTLTNDFKEPLESIVKAYYEDLNSLKYSEEYLNDEFMNTYFSKFIKVIQSICLITHQHLKHSNMQMLKKRTETHIESIKNKKTIEDRGLEL